MIPGLSVNLRFHQDHTFHRLRFTSSNKPCRLATSTPTPPLSPTHLSSLPSMADASDPSDALDANSSQSSPLSLQHTPGVHPALPPQPPPLHLTPCTWANIESFQEVPDQRYEVIDGIFIAMAVERVRHNRAVCLLLKLLELLLVVDAHWAPSHEVKYRLDDDDKPNYRIPDGACTPRDPYSPNSSSIPANTPRNTPPRNDSPPSSSSPRHTPSSSSSASSPHTARARVRQIAAQTINFLLENPAHIVVEYTSESTRTNDMTYKWVEYAVAGILFYIIIDAHDVSPDRKPRIIIGFKEMSVYQHSPTDEPVERHALNGYPPSENVDTEWFDHIALSDKDELYHKIVFEDDDPVSFGLFADLGMNASNFASPTYLEGRIKKEMKARGKSYSEYERVLKQVDELVEKMDKLQQKLAEERDEKGRLKQTLAERDHRVSELENEIFKLKHQTSVRHDREESSRLGSGRKTVSKAYASSSQTSSRSRDRPKSLEDDGSHSRSQSRSSRRRNSPASRRRSRSRSRSRSKSGAKESSRRRGSPASRRRSRSRSRSRSKSGERRTSRRRDSPASRRRSRSRSRSRSKSGAKESSRRRDSPASRRRSRSRSRSRSKSGERRTSRRRDSPASRRRSQSRSRSRSKSGERQSSRRRGSPASRRRSKVKDKSGKRGREERSKGSNRSEASNGLFGFFRGPQNSKSPPTKRGHR